MDRCSGRVTATRCLIGMWLAMACSAVAAENNYFYDPLAAMRTEVSSEQASAISAFDSSLAQATGAQAAGQVEPCAYCSDTTGCCDCCSCRRGFVFVDALALRATGSDVAHAQQQNGTGGAGTTPFGGIGVVDHDYNAGVRIGGGICLDACSDLVVSYTFFETDGDDLVEPPVIGGGAGAVGSLVHHPGAEITASVGPVEAMQDIEFQIGDAMFRYHWLRNQCSEVNLLLGLQYGHLEQSFMQLGNFAGGAGGPIDTSTNNITFDGGGLKIGIDGERYLRRCWTVYGRLTAAAMSGQFESNYRMYNAATTTDLAIVDWDENRVISQVEYELGLAWTSCNGCWHARVGYLFSHWNNVITTPAFIDAVQADNYTDVGDTITFDGGVARLECRW